LREYLKFSSLLNLSLNLNLPRADGLFQHPARAWIAIFKKAVIAYNYLIAGAWRSGETKYTGLQHRCCLARVTRRKSDLSRRIFRAFGPLLPPSLAYKTISSYS